MSEGETKPTVRWLDLAYAAVDELSMSATLLRVVSGIPGLAADDVELFDRAADRLARVVMQEVGRMTYEESIPRVNNQLDDILSYAKELAKIYPDADPDTDV